MRFVFIFSTVVFFTLPAMAQDQGPAVDTSSLQSVLANLKESAEKLNEDNDQLAARDKYIRQQILQLQGQLGRLESQGNTLSEAVSQLQDSDTRQSRQVIRLQQESSDLDGHIQKAQGAVKPAQRALDAAYAEDQKLLLQLKSMTGAPPMQDTGSAGLPSADVQKEKLKLMKMIYDSQARQEDLHQAIMAMQKNAPLQPAAAALAHQQLLKQQIQELGSQIASVPQDPAGANQDNAFDEGQIRRLEDELKDLEKNYTQLKDLMGQMDKKAHAAKMAADERAQEGKWQANIEDLNRQGVGLRAQLDDLRSQMVDLDKRKSSLEEMIKQLP